LHKTSLHKTSLSRGVVQQNISFPGADSPRHTYPHLFYFCVCRREGPCSSESRARDESRPVCARPVNVAGLTGIRQSLCWAPIPGARFLRMLKAKEKQDELTKRKPAEADAPHLFHAPIEVSPLLASFLSDCSRSRCCRISRTWLSPFSWMLLYRGQKLAGIPLGEISAGTSRRRTRFPGAADLR